MRRSIFNMYSLKLQDEKIYKMIFPLTTKESKPIVKTYLSNKILNDVTKQMDFLSKSLVMFIIEGLGKNDE